MVQESHIRLSVIVPLLNEVDNLPVLAAEIEAALNPLGIEWEAVWVDDGSTDGTREALIELGQQRPNHRPLLHAANAGQSAALCTGFDHARGELFATLDGDLQNDPANLPAMLSRLEREGVDVVNGFRAKRRDSLIRILSSRIGNGVRTWLTGKSVRDVGCSIRVFRRECVEHLPRFRGMHRFLPTLIALQGFSLTEMPVSHRPRQHGVTKYGISNRLWVGLGDALMVSWYRRRVFRAELDSGQA